MRRGRILLPFLAAVLLAVPSAAASSWNQRVAAAARYVEARAGVESFALVDERGRLHGYRVRMRAPSASLLKAMALVAYLDLPSVRGRPLRDADRRLLGPMIRRSDNAAASVVLRAVGARRLYRLAERASMVDFSFAWPIWGNSTTSARDQARFFWRIRSLVPRRHRIYALSVLASIVPSQRWGIPPVRPPRWSIHFKGGWGSGTGLVAHQSALLRRDGRRIAVSVLTRWNPSHAHGTATIRGVARRLLARPLPLAP
ncbi:MAG TPA: serine hydrolase [Gaiellaceae bacterium]|nr:serine hydrolase [Gaiellaceae bacterium]